MVFYVSHKAEFFNLVCTLIPLGQYRLHKAHQDDLFSMGKSVSWSCIASLRVLILHVTLQEAVGLLFSIMFDEKRQNRPLVS